jgi:exopolyphosphatase / guanosine-5'-triphosphate,3'-diphosphate pyrophosphatase
LELNGQANQHGNDWDEVSRLLGRAPAGAFTIVVRRPGGSPAVIENAPLLRDGRPMPTRYWLVDATVREAVSRLEASGGVRRATAAVPPVQVAAAHARHAAERDHALPPGYSGPKPSGGVGGTRQGVKCLHAHLAWYLAGGDDPVGRWTAVELGVGRDDFVAEGSGASDGPVAAVDCGTNSTRLIVVDRSSRVLDREMRITRLGEGVDATRGFAAGAIDRTLGVLRHYRRVMDNLGVVRSRAVATSAARDARNAEEFMHPAAEILGVRPEVLSGDEEGRLSFAGATAHLPVFGATGPILVVDIGGGSTELSVGVAPDGPGGRAGDVSTCSVEIGCVRVTERYLHHDPPCAGEIETARAAVAAELAGARAKLSALTPEGLLVGLAGTVSTLACLQMGVGSYDRERIHHSVLEREDVEHWLQTLATESAASRLARPGMVEGREDVIVGGVIVLAEVMAAFRRDECLVSEDDILDGMAAELLSERPQSAGGPGQV